ncbi:hypothetical protein SAY86_016177 [Trapa natans]|uniref:Reticulon-like protein n=1 Tax=Trapa natans TaxID=22666 RepID=A0AAN7QZM8_TRANT|nr:hypothetical protein SAY86_016177 [Trapa natans]
MVLIDDYWSDNPIPRTTCVVIGGHGFAGKWLVFRLLKLRKWIVRVADSAQSFQLDPSSHLDTALSEALSSGRASYHSIDVTEMSQIVGTIEGSSVVFYFDVGAAYDQNFYTSYMNIVQGAKNVINACRECKVKRLIYYSSADVVFDGSHDIYNATESMPCPSKYKDNWTELKAQAEKLVLFANDIDGLLTCSLRPSNVFGPGETQFMPFLLKQAKSGWTKFIIGTGENISDFTYVENIAHAHVCAEEALDSRSVAVAGKAFFVTNNEPMNFWKFVSLILEGLGYQRPFIKLPVVIVHYILLFGEWVQRELGVSRHNHMRSSHYIVSLASQTRTFDCAAAGEQIGYSPVVGLEEGILKTVESFSHLARDSLYSEYGNVSEQSKADRLLGSGKVADILLWRDERMTFTCFLSLVLLFYWFFLTGRTFISSSALLMMMVAIVSLVCSFLPSNLCGFSVPIISPTYFKVEEPLIKDLIRNVASLLNGGIHVTRLLARGEDWKIFLKAMTYLCILRFTIAWHMTLTVGAAIGFSFTSFFIYEQYEAEIDALAKVLLNRMKKLMRHFPVYVADSSFHRGRCTR